MKTFIFGDEIGYVKRNPSSIPASLANFNKETRSKYVTDLAAVSRGKEVSKNPEKRFQLLLKEAAPNLVLEGKEPEGQASRPLEFIPVIATFVPDIIDGKTALRLKNSPNIYFNFQDFCNKLVVYSYVDNEDLEDGIIKIYTNFRAMVNAGIPEDDIPFINSIVYRSKNYTTRINGNVIHTPDLDNGHLKHLVLKTLKDGYLLDLNKVYEYCGNNIYTIGKDIEEGYAYIPEYEHFKAIKLNIPMFIWSQLVTHTKISKESQSDRLTENPDYWLPEDILERIVEYKGEAGIGDMIKDHFDQNVVLGHIRKLKMMVESKKFSHTRPERLKMVVTYFTNHMTQQHVQMYLRELLYKREIWSRAPYYFRYKEVVFTGWSNDPSVWNHFFLERGATDVWKNWVQPETKRVVEIIKQVITGK